MCGITGFTGAPNKDQLVAMTRALIHRGPDEEGFYSGDGIHMGMRRLSIIDLKTGHQPIHNENQKIWVTCNGEIYNFQPLRAVLQEQGHRFYTHSDCEVLVHAYETYGDNFVSHLNGMFAIALWDSDRRRLLLVRDRLGVKPLYYHFDGTNLYYGSEIKSILKKVGFSKKISFEGLSHYLTYRNVPAPFTIYDGIYSLLPGECLVFEKGTLRKEKYWQIDYSKTVEYSEAEAEEKILDLLKDAVRLRLISDVPVGSYLSGGVDSSLVTAIACELGAKKIKTFSLGYAEKLDYKNDSFYAKMVSEMYGTDHYEYVMNADELPDNIVKILSHFDQPFAGVTSTFFLSKLVKEHVKVALTGDGADDQFGSYAHHRLCWPIENYLRARRQNLPDSTIDFRPYLGKENYVKGIAEDDLAQWRIKFYALTEAEKKQLLSCETYQAIRPYNSLDLLRKNLEHSEKFDTLNRLLDLDFNTLLPDEILVFADRLSMAHSIELRSPFLDYRFAEMVATMSGKIKIKDGISKYILKKVALRYLPQEIIDRPKEGFILPQDTWILGHMRSYVQELFSKEHLQLHGFFDHAAVDQLLRDYLERKHTSTYKILTLMMFQIWYEEFYLKND